MVTESQVDEAERKMRTAERRFENAGDSLGAEVKRYPGSVLTSCQRCIEHSAKAIFLLMGVTIPEDHAIDLDGENTRQLLNAVYSNFDEEYTKKAARLVFLSQVWGNVYPASEYGIQVDQISLEADDLLDRMEADQAYNHADEATTLARQLLNRAYEEVY
jgi:HEPN domain-containing protein